MYDKNESEFFKNTKSTNSYVHLPNFLIRLSNHRVLSSFAFASFGECSLVLAAYNEDENGYRRSK